MELSSWSLEAQINQSKSSIYMQWQSSSSQNLLNIWSLLKMSVNPWRGLGLYVALSCPFSFWHLVNISSNNMSKRLMFLRLRCHGQLILHSGIFSDSCRQSCIHPDLGCLEAAWFWLYKMLFNLLSYTLKINYCWKHKYINQKHKPCCILLSLYVCREVPGVRFPTESNQKFHIEMLVEALLS